jgi:hypothetical protein
VTAHAKYALGRSRISEILNFALAVSTSETRRAERLVSREDGQILNLVAAGAAAVCAIVADEGAIAEEEEVRIGVEEGPAGVASETVQMPSIASCR